MNFSKDIKKIILSTEKINFEECAFRIYEYQYQHCQVFQQFVNLVGKEPIKISALSDCAFLPIEFFKSKEIISTQASDYKIFTSSGTTGITTSQHFVSDTHFYDSLSVQLFEAQYGALNQYRVCALLPSYLEREGSSLVWMANHFIEATKANGSAFYLHNHDELVKVLQEKRPTLLLGVTFALLDLIELHELELSHCIVMETGGMKGRRKEMLREELHLKLTQSLNVQSIHSEYGMTELLSQAYSKGEGIFEASKSMRVFLRETTDPFTINNQLRYGAVNVIDLGNVDSCSFIATQDLGKYVTDNQFEIIGRMDNADVRGCNLMLT